MESDNEASNGAICGYHSDREVDDIEDGNSTESTELSNGDESGRSDEEIIEARSKRLNFKMDNNGGFSTNVPEVDGNRNGNTIGESDDGSIPYFMDEDDDSDQCYESGYSTESEGSVFEGENFQPIKNTRKYYFKEPNDPRDIYFEVGQIFMSREQFKNAVNENSLAIKKDIRYIRNESKAVSVVCASAKGCKWRIWLGYSKKDKLYHISSMYPKHNCGKSFKSKRINSKWIAKKYFSRFRTQPNWKLKDIKQEIFSTYEVSVSSTLCMRARRIALNDLVGDMVKHYAKLWDYKEELEITNPGSTIEIDYVDSQQGGLRYFKGIYICFDALKRGFLGGCRPCIGLDGCFLKGIQRGILLTCVGRDANDQMYPVAWAVVQVENNDTWSWFLSLLMGDLDMIDGGKGWTLITDQQKGLVPAIAELLPNAEHRMCARHIFSNWHKVFKGGNLRLLFWKIAKSSTMEQMEKNFERLKEIDKIAYEDLRERGVQHWCMAYFNTFCKVSNVDNNLAEAWNWSLVELRGKPIIYMLEDIRRSLMERIHKRRDWMYKKEINICPRIVKKIRMTADEIKYWSVHQNGACLFEVIKGNDGFVVNLSDGTCTCRMFQLEGLPCSHSMAAIQHVGENPENYVSAFFKKECFVKTYSQLINPLSGEEQWSIVDKEPLLPPPTRRMPGRPRKKRVRDSTETRVVQGIHKLVKSGTSSTCGICKSKGHNRRRCPDRKDDDVVLPKRSVRHADKDQSKLVYAKQRNKKRIHPKVVPTTSATPSVGIEVNTQRNQVGQAFM